MAEADIYSPKTKQPVLAKMPMSSNGYHRDFHAPHFLSSLPPAFGSEYDLQRDNLPPLNVMENKSHLSASIRTVHEPVANRGPDEVRHAYENTTEQSPMLPSGGFRTGFEPSGATQEQQLAQLTQPAVKKKTFPRDIFPFSVKKNKGLIPLGV
jgi:hypothetical protein